MPDIENTGEQGAAEAAPTQTEGNEGSPDNSASTDFSAGGGDEAGDDDQGDDGDGEDAGDGDDTIEDDGSDPTVRRDPSYYVGLRHGKKAARQGKPATNAADDDQGNDDDGDDDDSDLHPEDAEILNQAVAQAVKPLTDQIQQQKDQAELNTFISENPHFKPYQAKIERFLKHPSRSHLPISTIAMEAAGPEGMMKIGARMARTADTKKNSSKSGGSTGGNRGGAPAKSAWEMSPEEFAAEQQRVRQGA